jgi:hypothetical protein
MRMPGFTADAAFDSRAEIYWTRHGTNPVRTAEPEIEPASLVGTICAYFLGVRFCRILGLDPEN